MGERKYDFIVIGAGVAGLAAGMCGARSGMKTLVLGASHGSEMPIGGVITTTNLVENYPGFIKLTGNELAERIRKHAESYDKVTIKEEKVENVKKGFKVKTEKGEYSGKAVLFATGTRWRKLEVPGGRGLRIRVLVIVLCATGRYIKTKLLQLLEALMLLQKMHCYWQSMLKKFI